jgi:hypothetical protein
MDADQTGAVRQTWSTTLDEPRVRRALVQHAQRELRYSTVGMSRASVPAAEEGQRQQALDCALHVIYLCVGVDGAL